MTIAWILSWYNLTGRSGSLLHLPVDTAGKKSKVSVPPTLPSSTPRLTLSSLETHMGMQPSQLCKQFKTKQNKKVPLKDKYMTWALRVALWILGVYSLGCHHSGTHDHKISGGWVFHDGVCTCNVFLKYFFTLALALAHFTTCFFLEWRGKKPVTKYESIKCNRQQPTYSYSSNTPLITTRWTQKYTM